MKYLTEVVFAAIVCGILTHIAPSGKSQTGKYVKYVASLVFLFIILSPIVGDADFLSGMATDITDIGAIGENSTVDIEESEYHYGNLETVSSEICKAAVKAASENFAVSADDFSVKLIIDKSDSAKYSIREVTVYTKGEASKISSETMQNYFEEILDSPTEVIKNEK